MGISLSTSWNAFRYNNGKELIREIKDLGFNAVELSFNLTEEMVRDIAELAEEKQIKVNSLHNYCPIPRGLSRQEALPDCFSLASLDPEQRQKALKYTKISIDTAFRLKAEAVVLHCGRVEIADRTRELFVFYDTNGGLSSVPALRLKDKMRQEREKRISGHLDAVLKSLEELVDYSTGLKVKLGIENRFYFREIPSFEETGEILERFQGANVFYWHDTGHAQLWENLGFLRHQDYLERYQQSLLGFHLHDIKGTRDHLAPGGGDYDFSVLKPYLKKDTIKTLEAHHPASPREIIQAREFLDDLYGSD